ncbi:hypothetical protein SAMN05880561_103112 [Rhizobium sp. RU33A]|uniref:DUF6456 domain-containing protein n=1 Tax=Rhizobium sp. RU33A TaxID=1907413 RepID=UPI00095619FE|nr:DUF6456 domain-containing protein [Rhizobium sp. RU33A]SIQ47343.1 hypothetical protein SAMN05880561_103112 [Rhizobium sp. RU33A]
MTRSERKQIRQLLRRALAGTLEQPPHGASGRAASSPTDDGTPELLARLVADGLLLRTQDGLAPTAETAAWLRRDLCDLPEEAHAGQHRTVEVGTLDMPQGRQSVRRNLQESPLFPLLRLKEKDGRPFLPEEAVAAGERLAADFDFAGLQPRITASWQPRLSTRNTGAPLPAADFADATLSARNRVNRAVQAMGPELSGVALDVCCFGKGLETVEHERQWPARSAKLMLRTALLSLARHYAPPPLRPRTRHWGDEGFRPEIS